MLCLSALHHLCMKTSQNVELASLSPRPSDGTQNVLSCAPSTSNPMPHVLPVFPVFFNIADYLQEKCACVLCVLALGMMGRYPLSVQSFSLLVEKEPALFLPLARLRFNLTLWVREGEFKPWCQLLFQIWRSQMLVLTPQNMNYGLLGALW